MHSYAAVGLGRKMVDWSGSVFRRAWQRSTGALTEFAFTGTTVSWTYWLRAWCHGTTFLHWPEGKMSVLHKTMYPRFRRRELHVVQHDRLIHCMTAQLSTWGLGAGCHCDRSSFCFPTKTSCKMLYVRCPCHFLYRVRVHACVCVQVQTCQ